MKEHKKSVKNWVPYLLIVLGALMASFSVACILLPNDAIDYGTAGIAIIISYLTNWNLSLCVVLVFTPFLVLGAVFLGRHFFIKALVGSAAYTIGIELFEKTAFTISTEHFLAVAFGGAILGIGLSLILRNGGCIDGSEILANIIVKKLSDKTGKNYGLSVFLVIFNICVYLAVFVLINSNSAMLSLLVYVVATVILDKFTDHYEAIKQITIITKDPDTIKKQIKDQLNKTCTIIDSTGAIAGKNSTLICYVNYFELQKMRDIISSNKGTFSTVSNIDEILR